MLQPLAMTLLIAFVFSRIFKVDIDRYAPYILSGIVVWDFVSTILNGGALAFLQADAYIRQTRHPLAIYTLRVTLAALVVMAIAAVPLVAWVALALPGTFGWSWLAALLIFPVAALIGWPVATVLACITARFRDVPFALTLLLQALWFVSPVYFEARLFREAGLTALVEFNPVYHVLQLLRAPLLDGQWPTWANLGWAGGTIVVVMAVAAFVVRRLEPRTIFYL